MTFKGNLRAVSATDLMQYLHLCRRTGTLRISAGELHATIGFHLGNIVSASGPSSRRLGDLLVETGALEETTLVAALALQVTERPRRSLGQVLIQSGAATPGTIFDAVRGQLERVVRSITAWNHGDFEFTLDEWHPIDDLALQPAELIPHVQLDTEQVLLEAQRLRDEWRRGDQGG